MKIIKADLGVDHEVVLWGDIHEGSVMQNADAVDQTINYIKNGKNIYAINMGDFCEAKTVDHPHYQKEVHEKTVMEQYKNVREKIRPVANKHILMLEGNHDWRLSRIIGNTVKILICDELGIEFGGYTSIVWVMNGKKLLYKIFVTHGAGSINSRIDDPDERLHSMLRALRRKLFLKAGDCLVMVSGHNHRLLVKPPSSSLELKTEERKKKKDLEHEKKAVDPLRIKSFYSDDLKEINHNYIYPSNRWYVSTGGFLRLFAEQGDITGYQEISGLDPLEVGYAKIICREGKIINIERIILG